MPTTQITQLRRVIFRKKASAADSWTGFTMEADDLGQDTIMSVTIAPRKAERNSSVASTSTPIAGTLGEFAGSITFLADSFKLLGQAMGRFTAATYASASATAGQITDDASNLCGDGEYYDVIAQGICDDGSEADIELTRCIPTVDDALEFGTGSTQTVTLNLNPQVYNAARHSSDGYPARSYRFGVENISKKTRLNAVTFDYDDVSE
jgi:hypothetical protein